MASLTREEMRMAPGTPPDREGRPPWAALAVQGVCSLYLWSLASLIAWALVPVVLGWTPTVITSGSMAPAIQPGDVVVTAPHDGDGLASGQVVVFRDPAEPDRLVTHRVVAELDNGYRTRGDANRTADSTPVPAGHVEGTARALVPLLGTPLLWARQGHIPLVLAWLAATVLAVLGAASPPGTARVPAGRADPDDAEGGPAGGPTGPADGDPPSGEPRPPVGDRPGLPGPWTARTHRREVRRHPAPDGGRAGATGPTPDRAVPATSPRRSPPVGDRPGPPGLWTARPQSSRTRPRALLGLGLAVLALSTSLLVTVHGAFSDASPSAGNWAADQLPVPADVTAVTTCGNVTKTITVEWTAVSSGSAADGYSIYRSTTSGGPFDEHRGDVDGVGSTSFQDSGLTLDSQAYYYVARSARLSTTWESDNSLEADAGTC